MKKFINMVAESARAASVGRFISYYSTPRDMSNIVARFTSFGYGLHSYHRMWLQGENVWGLDCWLLGISNFCGKNLEFLLNHILNDFFITNGMNHHSKLCIPKI